MASIFDTANPDLMAQQAILDRQQAMAQMLQQQSMENSPTQFTGGQYSRAVGPSPMQGIARLAQALMGSRAQSNVDAQKIALAHAMQQRMGNLFDQMLGGGGDAPQSQTPQSQPIDAHAIGQAAPAGGMTDAITNAAIQATPQASNPAIAQASNPAIDRLRNAARAAMLMGNTDLANKLIENGMTLTNEQKNLAGQDPQMYGRALMAKAVKEGRMEAQPGNTIIDPITLRPLYTAPDFKSGTQGGFDANGSPVMGGIQGNGVLAQLAGQNAGAVAGAQANWKPNTVTLPNGKTIMGSDAQLLGAGRNGGLELQSGAAKNYTDLSGTNTANAENELNNRIQQEGGLNVRMGESLKALDNFNAGGGSETRAALGQAAQAFGLPNTTVNKIAGGDLASIQEFKKLAVQQAMEALKSAVSNGKITQAEFKIFQDNNPNINTDPGAIRKIFDFNTKLYNNDLTEQKYRAEFNQSGGQPQNFPAFWSQKQAELGITNPGLSAQPPTASPNGPHGVPASNGWSIKKVN